MIASHEITRDWDGRSAVLTKAKRAPTFFVHDGGDTSSRSAVLTKAKRALPNASRFILPVQGRSAVLTKAKRARVQALLLEAYTFAGSQRRPHQSEAGTIAHTNSWWPHLN